MTTPSSPLLIGLGGFPESGKDTVAEFLRDDFGFEIFGMSDTLRDTLSLLDPIVSVEGGLTARQAVERYGYAGAKARFPEYRRLLRVLGTEIGRDMLGPAVWLRPTANKILARLRDGVPCVLTGVRFSNEMDWLRAASGHAVWVDRPGKETATHVSDLSLGPEHFDLLLANDGDLLHLRTMTHVLYRGLERLYRSED